MRICDGPLTAARLTEPGEPELSVRIRGEFAEMPGLRLTVPQASRLFNLESGRCERLLEALVRDGKLSTIGKLFVRRGSGREWT